MGSRLKRDTDTNDAAEYNTTHDEWVNIPTGILLHPKLTALEKLVWFQVARYDGSNRHCTASNRTMGEILDVHPISVSKAIKTLIDHKLLEQVSDDPRVLKRPDNYLNLIRPISERYHQMVYTKTVVRTGNHPLASGLTPLSLQANPPKPTGLGNIKSIEIKSKEKKSKELSSITAANAAEIEMSSLTPSIKAVVTHWKKHGLHLPGVETKAWRDSINMINGLLTGAAFSNMPSLKEHKRRYNLAEIKLSIDRFAKSVHDADVLPVNKALVKGTTPAKFILNRHCMVKANGIGHSQFVHYLTHEPQSVTKPEALDHDAHPELTKQLIHEYNSTVMGGIQPKLTVANHNRFILAAKKLHAFAKEFRNKFHDHSDLSIRNMAKLLVAAIVEDQHGVTQKISPGYLCSNETFSRRFPAYLYQQAYIKEDVEGKPWQYAVNQWVPESPNTLN